MSTSRESKIGKGEKFDKKLWVGKTFKCIDRAIARAKLRFKLDALIMLCETIWSGQRQLYCKILFLAVTVSIPTIFIKWSM